jgi:hypothetical protein
MSCEGGMVGPDVRPLVVQRSSREINYKTDNLLFYPVAVCVAAATLQSHCRSAYIGFKSSRIIRSVVKVKCDSINRKYTSGRPAEGQTLVNAINIAFLHDAAAPALHQTMHVTSNQMRLICLRCSTFVGRACNIMQWQVCMQSVSDLVMTVSTL